MYLSMKLQMSRTSVSLESQSTFKLFFSIKKQFPNYKFVYGRKNKKKKKHWVKY